MIVVGIFDGAKFGAYNDKNGNEQEYATILFRSVDANGEPDFEQCSFRSFDSRVVKAVKGYERGSMVTLDLKISSATVVSLD